MSLINVLDISVANLIAAGEVVERPSSAVKELIENSIDAGSKKIAVEIKNGGVSMLRVTDDGSGMSAEDALLSIKRHATSKIKTAADLSKIMTLGFRGEALAAISAVTKFRMLTKRREDETGTSLSCAYGSAPKIEEAGCPDGTTIICEGLFATTPARLKFLKSDMSEASSVEGVVERAAVSHPEISFKFISDGAIKFTTVGDGKLDGAIYAVYGRAFANALTRVEAREGNIGVEGYISSPVFTRGNRGMQIFFVNGRSVRSKLLQAALEQAYQSYIAVGKFPSCVLNISIHSAYVDVNIHPSKLEVKFSDERVVFSALYYAVRSALESGVSRPSMEIPRDKLKEESEKIKITEAFVPISERGERDAEQLKITDFGVAKSNNVNISISYNEPEKPFSRQADGTYRRADISELVKEIPAEPVLRSNVAEKLTGGAASQTDAKIPGKNHNPIPEYRIAGEIFDTYVILELEDRIMLVDKHAAHERINFEILRAQMKELTPNIQLLMIPENVTMTAEEAEMCRIFKDELGGVGFVFEIDGNTAKISGVPIGYDVKSGIDLFEEALSSLVDEGIPPEIKKRSVFEHALYQTSCKMSIKAGRRYGEEHLRWICDNLLRYDCIKFCPHGRPVAYEITKRELDARFGRIK